MSQSKSKSKKKSKLINSGSYGCVFYPKIPCEKEKKQKQKSVNKRATKLILFDDSLYDEYKINQSIQKINNHQEWTVIWDDKCLSPKYRKLKKISQIDKCIDPKKQKVNLKKFLDLGIEINWSELKQIHNNSINGIVIAHELLDAFPVERIE